MVADRGVEQKNERVRIGHVHLVHFAADEEIEFARRAIDCKRVLWHERIITLKRAKNKLFVAPLARRRFRNGKRILFKRVVKKLLRANFFIRIISYIYFITQTLLKFTKIYYIMHSIFYIFNKIFVPSYILIPFFGNCSFIIVVVLSKPSGSFSI